MSSSTLTQPTAAPATTRSRPAQRVARTALSYAHRPSDIPLLADTVGDLLRHAAEVFGDRDALVVRHQQYRASYAELWQQVDRAARALLALDVRKGDRVGIWAPNRFEWVVTQFATARVGAILVTVNPAYQAEELQYALTKAGVSLLVMSSGFRDSDYVAMLASVRPRCTALRGAIVLEEDWDEFLSAGDDITDDELAAREASLQFDDAINIQFTSGTTGNPKGATLSHHNIVNNAHLVAETLQYSEIDRACVPMPFYHCFGMVLGTLACVSRGACIVVPAEAFDPVEVLAAVEAERCTALHGVPTMFIAELTELDGRLDGREYDLSTLRTGMMGGAPCPAEVMQELPGRG